MSNDPDKELFKEELNFDVEIPELETWEADDILIDDDGIIREGVY